MKKWICWYTAKGVPLASGKTCGASREENWQMPTGEHRFWQLGIVLTLGMSGAIAENLDEAIAMRVYNGANSFFR